jgi:2-polyprenyl-6-methoxyphenol hydroxylase-like FAD-dependent oxidoreductase
MGSFEGPDVIVVGAGPTGLMLSRELALAGVPARVVERRKSATSESRALGLQARTLEVFDMRGIADEVVSEGNPIPRVRLSLGQSVLDLKRLDTRFGQLHITPQSRTEAILERHTRSLGVTVERNTEVVGVTQAVDHAVVRLRRGDREWEERTRWVIGCDGPYSVVRRSQGIDFPGKVYPYTIIVADVLLDEEPADPLLIRVGRHGLVVSTDFGNGRFRMGVIDRKKPWSEDPVGLEEVRTTLAALFGRDVGPHDPSWTSRFRIQERQATAYRKGRILLAGDAAHVHSPLGGQGLNLGLQDAMNLGWKLAAVVRGDAPEELLDSYETERRRVSSGVIKATDIATRMMTSPLLPPRVLRRIVVPVALRLSRSHQWLAGGLSGISVRYPDGESADHAANRLGPGSRLPDVEILRPDAPPTSLFQELRSCGFVLIDSDGRLTAATEPWHDRVHAVVGRVPQPGFENFGGILSRPDGYCAWAGDSADIAGLTTALGRWAGRSHDAAALAPPSGGLNR